MNEGNAEEILEILHTRLEKDTNGDLFYCLARVYKFIGEAEDYYNALKSALENPYTLTFPKDVIRREFKAIEEKLGHREEIKPETEIPQYAAAEVNEGVNEGVNDEEEGASESYLEEDDSSEFDEEVEDEISDDEDIDENSDDDFDEDENYNELEEAEDSEDEDSEYDDEDFEEEDDEEEDFEEENEDESDDEDEEMDDE